MKEATGPGERAQPEPVATEPLELTWSGEGESADWPELPDLGVNGAPILGLEVG